ncbi:MAG: small subunit ribosomal protein [Patescibacteria group bacterium]|nr:small subunit ribosomal protein [Patescibacteria group bacterium]
MLVIRLQRRGRKGLAMYRMVVQDKRTHPSKEKVVARLGNYNPHTKELNLDNELAQKYLDAGAQPSPRSVKLLKLSGVKLPAWVKEVANKPRTTRNAEKLRKNQPKEEVAEAPAESEETSETEVETTEETTEASKEETSTEA